MNTIIMLGDAERPNRAHPCPAPHRTRHHYDGCLWMCKCGKTWVLRKTYSMSDVFWDWQEASTGGNENTYPSK